MPSFQASPPGIFSRPVLRRLLAIFFPVALFMGCVVFALYYQDLTKERTLLEQAGENLVDLQWNIITRELKSVQRDLLYLADQQILRSFLSKMDSDKGQLEREYRLFAQSKGIYDQIRYLNREGFERIRINYNDGDPSIVPEKMLQRKADRYYFTEAIGLDRGQVFISPFDLNVEHDQIEKPHKPVIRFATPVFDDQGVKRGVLVLNYLGASLLRELDKVSTYVEKEAWLLNRDGYFLHVGSFRYPESTSNWPEPAPEDEWSFMFNKQRNFQSYYPDQWLGVTQSGKGHFYSPQGLFIFRTLSPRAELAEDRGANHLANEIPDPMADDASVIVLSHVPPDVLDQRATILLHRLIWLDGGVLVLVLILTWYLAYAGALRQSHERQIADSEGRLRTLSTQLLTAQEDERRRLSRDLHDELGQIVTTVALDLQRAAQAADGEKKAELIGRAFKETECLLDRIHEISARLRPTLLDDLGLKDAVQNFLSEYEQRTGIVPRAELRFEHPQIPAAVSENVYRILQEALTNVSKHARAKEVFIGLQADARCVALTVRDSGSGFNPAALDGKGLGILGMRERAELLGGNFVVKAEVGKGTEIRVSIPIHPHRIAATADGDVR
jgi:signal transduction histidine kinase